MESIEHQGGPGRFPRGKRGLKSPYFSYTCSLWGRFPRGKRGLKYLPCRFGGREQKSLPPREAWIEIDDIQLSLFKGTESLPPREAWIEIGPWQYAGSGENVASPAGSVD